MAAAILRRSDGGPARVAVAMSGGVDSCVSAALLREAGYEVFGVTMALWSCHSRPSATTKTCCSTADVEDARAVCRTLGIPHVVADFRTEFRTQVIEAFVAEYRQGRTPIPCIGCNQYFKFDRLWDFVQTEHGADYLATGHYCRILRDAAGEPQAVCRARDRRKDQSYYLFVMTPEQIRHSLFPLGELTKREVRALAERFGLSTADKPESQEICFVPDNDYAGFIEEYYPEAAGRPGAFVDASGRELGRHRGTHAYTIGQRRGLNLSAGERRYVTHIDSATARVTVGPRGALARRGLRAQRVNWTGSAPAVGTERALQVKIRAQHEPVAAQVLILDDGAVRVQFREPQNAVTPGQALVLYDGEAMLGGGWIAEAYE